MRDQKDGTRRLYSVDTEGLAALRAYLETYWNTALAAFKEAAEGPDEEGGHVVSGIEPIRASISVRTDPARAFEVFTRRLDTWWPLEVHSLAVDEFDGGAQGRAGRLRGARRRAGARAPL